MEGEIQIREAADTGADLAEILRINKSAFEQDEEADLVQALLKDPSAQPVLSLLAFEDGEAVGHILFTSARLTDRQDDRSDLTPSVALLAPLAVVPRVQKHGIGGRLIGTGLRILADRGVDLVFVLGHPSYYPRHGFSPAGAARLETPYPILEKNADAWMVQALSSHMIGLVRGTVQCAHAISKPEYWVE